MKNLKITLEAEYTHGNYTEIISDDVLWRGPVQVFESFLKFNL